MDNQAKPTLVIQGDKIVSFPRYSESNFSSLCNNKHFAYFDRTRYISVLDSIDNTALLFLRPRRFGKSLTISMLEHFHGIRYKAEYDMLSRFGAVISLPGLSNGPINVFLCVHIGS